jgi:hypothetical protein
MADPEPTPPEPTPAPTEPIPEQPKIDHVRILTEVADALKALDTRLSKVEDHLRSKHVEL